MTVTPSVLMADVAGADDGVAGPHAPLPLLDQVLVHPTDVAERPAEALQRGAV